MVVHALSEGIRGGYASAKQNFPRKTGTTAVRDHGITTRRADAAERVEVAGSAVAHVHLVLHVRFVLVLQT
jgi:hypothetical protein